MWKTLKSIPLTLDSDQETLSFGGYGYFFKSIFTLENEFCLSKVTVTILIVRSYYSATTGHCEHCTDMHPTTCITHYILSQNTKQREKDLLLPWLKCICRDSCSFCPTYPQIMFSFTILYNLTLIHLTCFVFQNLLQNTETFENYKFFFNHIIQKPPQSFLLTFHCTFSSYFYAWRRHINHQAVVFLMKICPVLYSPKTPNISEWFIP